MPRWMNRVYKMVQDMRGFQGDANIIVIWETPDGEVTVFTARNFEEVRTWLRAEDASRTVH